ncbi:MAG: hypothetical protein KIC94_17890 [Clostridiales bacterium]|nr:hypothetical protein [Clostridiales bacterium]
MKSDKEFIDGIYEKARMLQEQEAHNKQGSYSIVDKNKSWFRRNFNTNKFRAGMAVVAMAVVAVILIPSILVKQGNQISDNVDEYSIEPAAYGIDNQRALPAETIGGEGILVDSFINNGEGYYLVAPSELNAADAVLSYIVLYDNGFNKDKLEKATIGTNISFTYVEAPVSLLTDIQDALNKQFGQELAGKPIADTIAVYPIDTIQIKE